MYLGFSNVKYVQWTADALKDTHALWLCLTSLVEERNKGIAQDRQLRFQLGSDVESTLWLCIFDSLLMLPFDCLQPSQNW